MLQGEITIDYEAEVDDNDEALYRRGDVSPLQLYWIHLQHGVCMLLVNKNAAPSIHFG